jgi:hypothetical protein
MKATDRISGATTFVRICTKLLSENALSFCPKMHETFVRICTKLLPEFARNFCPNMRANLSEYARKFVRICTKICPDTQTTFVRIYTKFLSEYDPNELIKRRSVLLDTLTTYLLSTIYNQMPMYVCMYTDQFYLKKKNLPSLHNLPSQIYDKKSAPNFFASPKKFMPSS